MVCVGIWKMTRPMSIKLSHTYLFQEFLGVKLGQFGKWVGNFADWWIPILATGLACLFVRLLEMELARRAMTEHRRIHPHHIPMEATDPGTSRSQVQQIDPSVLADMEGNQNG